VSKLQWNHDASVYNKSLRYGGVSAPKRACCVFNGRSWVVTIVTSMGRVFQRYYPKKDARDDDCEKFAKGDVDKANDMIKRGAVSFASMGSGKPPILVEHPFWHHFVDEYKELLIDSVMDVARLFINDATPDMFPAPER